MFGATLLAVSSGCGNANDGPETYPTTGTVTYQSQPVSGATVIFFPTDDSQAAQAITNEDGSFEVYTYYDMGRQEKPGIAAGEYRVTATKLDRESIKTTLQPPKDLLPSKYGNVKNSGLTATVTPGEENHFEFELK